MRKTIVLFLFALYCLPSSSQKPCSAPEFRQFDFWIGEWEAFGKNGKKAGDSKISLILDSCTILEEWTSANLQNGFRYSGKSFNMYNASNKNWQQYWIDNTGSVTNYNSGKYLNGKLVYTTENVKVNDTTWLMQRLTFYNIGKDKVRQHGENSGDGGKTWTTSYDLEYRRKQ
jgi:hypothetical protein